MICKKCKRSVVMHAFSSGDCQLCGKAVVTSHTPCHKVCVECSNEKEVCQKCGRKIGLEEEE